MAYRGPRERRFNIDIYPNRTWTEFTVCGYWRGEDESGEEYASLGEALAAVRALIESAN